jgi:asparagine N-glycosylation enzyme membrane subunit Stt3
MSLVTIFLVLVVAGLVLWLVKRFIPMDATIYNILLAVVVIFLVLWLLQGFGILRHFSDVRLR